MSKNVQIAKSREDMRTFVNALVVDSANTYRNWLYGSDDEFEEPSIKSTNSSPEGTSNSAGIRCE